MPDSRDELFLRLAIRQGLFSKEDAVKLLAYYRENHHTREGIGHFLVREGYLEEDVAEKFRLAIAKRAEGHVADNRTRTGRLNKAGGAGGGQPVRHHHHVSARPKTVKADALQLVLISLGAIIAIGALIWLAAEMTTGGDQGGAMVRSMEEEKAAKEAAAAKEIADAKAKEREAAREAANVVPASFSESELTAFKNRADAAQTDASGAASDRRLTLALDMLTKEIDGLKSEFAPDSILTPLYELKTDFEATRQSFYENYVSELRKATAAGNAKDIQKYTDKIKDELGEELLAKAQEELAQ